MSDMSERVKVWDWPLRLFHWTLVVAIALAFLSAEEESALNDWHVLSGWVAAVLVVFRLVWGFLGGEHSRFSDFIRPSRIGHHVAGLLGGRREPSLGHNPLGALAVLVMLALTAITVWSGAFGGEAAEELHEVVGWTLLAMVVLHIVAVIAMSVIERENLVRAMITGDKPAARHPGAVDARRPEPLALLAAAAVVAAAAYAVLQYDRDAFTPRSAESYEHRGAVAKEATAREREEGETD